MLLSTLVEQFIASKSLWVSERTIEWYHYNLDPLVEILGQKDVTQVATEDLEAFLSAQTPDRSVRTLEGFYTAVHILFAWALKRGKLVIDPMASIEIPRAPLPIPEIFTEEQICALLEAANNRRDRAILLVLLDTGLRRNELIHLNFEDLDLAEGFLLIRSGKGRKDRFVPIGETATAAIREMLMAHPHNGPLFLNCHGTRLQAGGLRSMLLRLRERAGMNCRVHPHKFRHTFARNYLMQGGDLESLRDILGHTSIHLTAEIYGTFTRARLKEKHRRCSPVDHATWIDF